MKTVVTANLKDPAHRDAILNLLDNYASDPMGKQATLPESSRARLLTGLAEQPQALVLLAFEDDTPAGLLIAFQGFSTFQASPLLNIHDLIVHPDYRGHGLGRQLLQEAERQALDRGCSQITLEVRSDNAAAQRLYQSEGFTDCLPRMWFWKKQL